MAELRGHLADCVQRHAYHENSNETSEALAAT